MRTIMSFIIVLSLTTVYGQSAGTSDFKAATGAWKGSITYLDYSSGKPFSMPAELNLQIGGAGQVIFSYAYPKEPKANGNDTLIISMDGKEIDGAKIISREVQEDGAIKLVTAKDGLDGNDHKKAVIKHTYIIGRNSFQSAKEVKFEGTDKWIIRNQFAFGR